jgi:CBS domain-containing protein
MKVRDIMTSPVVSIAPDSTVLDAVRIMLLRHISGLPVIDKSGSLVGIVTEGDFLRRAETGTQRRRPRWLEYLLGPGRLADEYTRSHGRKVHEIMTFGALSITEDTPLDEVVRLMEKRQIKRLPVVRGNEVVGIVSRANLVHALAGLAREVRLQPVTRPSTTGSSPSWQVNRGRRRHSSTSSSGTVWWNCGERSPTSGSARPSWSPQRMRQV